MEKFTLAKIKNKKLNSINMLKNSPLFKGKRERNLFKLKFSKDNINIIAEIKKSSPSNGEINNIDPILQAKKYAKAGVNAISVLTDPFYFNGSFDDLKLVAENIDLPILCKEFICDINQIKYAYLCGADIILLINKMLKFNELKTLYNYAIELSLIPLIEIHDLYELETVLKLNPQYLMVNMRNLENLTINFDTGIKTLKNIPENIIKISASGINSKNDIIKIFNETNTNNFLIGTLLMKNNNPEYLIKEFKDVC